jgi:two-component SAPR family response regulator
LALRKYCNGVELAGCLRATRPEMTVVYISGEAEWTDAATQELLKGDALQLDKPLNPGDLEATLSAVACRAPRVSAYASRLCSIRA